MSLHPRQIEIFRMVMDDGGMTAAGRRLGISQPAVSRMIRDLELRLDLRLFDRRGSRLVPTHEGVLLYEQVCSLFSGLERIEEAASDIRAAKLGSLRIAALSDLSGGFLNRVLAEFLSSRRQVSVSLRAESSRNVVQIVAMHQVDVGIVQYTGDHPAVETMRLPPLEAACVLPAGHPLAARAVVEATDLVGLPIISLRRDSPLRMHFDAVLLAAGLRTERFVETSLSSSACELVAHGLGVAVISPFATTGLDPTRVVRRRFRPIVPYEIAIIFPVNRRRSAVVDDFVASFRAAVAGSFPPA